MKDNGLPEELYWELAAVDECSNDISALGGRCWRIM